MREMSDASRPRNMNRHLQTVFLLSHCVRQSCGRGMPASASFKTAMIWLSVNRYGLIEISSSLCPQVAAIPMR